MAVQILSDLHLEAPRAYDIFQIIPKSPVLALIGDIGTVVADKADFFDFIKRQLGLFRTVLFVPGNHEAYHSSWAATIETLKEFQAAVEKDTSLGQFVLLEREAFRVSDSNVVVLGCSLFSRVPAKSTNEVTLRLRDFYETKEWDVPAHNESHARDLKWLNETVRELEKEAEDVDIIILSHWSSSTDPRAVEPRHAGSTISTAFSTDLSKERCFKSPRTKIWAFGHTHYNCDFEVERKHGIPLRIVTNQRGYYFAQADGFDPEKVLTIERSERAPEGQPEPVGAEGRSGVAGVLFRMKNRLKLPHNSGGSDASMNI